MSSKQGNIQYGALPYSLSRDGALRILLVTSRGTRRWIIPKGWPIRFLRPHKAAAQEAFEEAGVVGRAVKKSVGSYEYDKTGDDGSVIRCTVTVFPLEVEILHHIWPEAAERERRWFSSAEAADRVDEPQLRDILARFSPLSRTSALGSSRR